VIGTERHAALAATRRLRRCMIVGEPRIYFVEIPATIAGIAFLWSLAIARNEFQHLLGYLSLR
jgi:hypothetical protein